MEATGNLLGNKIGDKITGTSKTVPSKTEDLEFQKSIKIPQRKININKKSNKLHWPELSSKSNL